MNKTDTDRVRELCKVSAQILDERSSTVTVAADMLVVVLQDAHDVLVTLDSLKSFGLSAFGPLRFRPVDANGAKGDWQSLAILVRTPSLKEIRCPAKPDEQCTLIGTKLFLIDSVAADPEFKHSVSIPIGFAETSVSVPRIDGTPVYLKLRDDPSIANIVILPVVPQ